MFIFINVEFSKRAETGDGISTDEMSISAMVDIIRLWYSLVWDFRAYSEQT